MATESKNPNQKSSSKLVIVIIALVAVVGIAWMLMKKSSPPVPVVEETSDTQIQAAAPTQSQPKRPTADEAPATEEPKEPEKNAESTWMIEDFTDPKKSWANYKMKNTRITEKGIELVPGAKEGTFESPVMTMPLPANMVAPLWKQEVPKGAAVRVEMAISGDNQSWSPWYPLADTGDDISPLYPDGTPNPNYGHVPGAYISTGLDLAAFTRYRFTLSTEGGEQDYRMADGSFADTLRVPGLRVYVSDSTLGDGKMITKDTLPPGVPGNETPAGSEETVAQ